MDVKDDLVEASLALLCASVHSISNFLSFHRIKLSPIRRLVTRGPISHLPFDPFSQLPSLSFVKIVYIGAVLAESET